MEMKNIPKVFADAGALSSVVEHYLHTVGVVGSKPTARTIFRHFHPGLSFPFLPIRLFSISRMASLVTVIASSLAFHR